jgi:3-oxoacyl-[acyl-carrier protein] reductase
MKLENKVALITGAGSGMGRASAILFSKEGSKISVVDVDSKTGKETVDAIKDMGGEAIFVQADVSSAPDVERMVKTTADTYGKLDILFNNAGIAMAFTPIEDVEEAFWDRIMAINLKSIFLGCKYAIPIMKKQGGGVILNTASIIGVRPRPRLNAYLASKAAAINLTKGIALEVADHNIRVNCINPVATDTPMFPYFIDDSGAKDAKFEEMKEKFVAGIPLGRLAKSEDVAYAALFLAADEASFLTGVSLDVDGGRSI